MCQAQFQTLWPHPTSTVALPPAAGVSRAAQRNPSTRPAPGALWDLEAVSAGLGRGLPRTWAYVGLILETSAPLYLGQKPHCGFRRSRQDTREVCLSLQKPQGTGGAGTPFIWQHAAARSGEHCCPWGTLLVGGLYFPRGRGAGLDHFQAVGSLARARSWTAGPRKPPTLLIQGSHVPILPPPTLSHPVPHLLRGFGMVGAAHTQPGPPCPAWGLACHRRPGLSLGPSHLWRAVRPREGQAGHRAGGSRAPLLLRPAIFQTCHCERLSQV